MTDFEMLGETAAAAELAAWNGSFGERESMRRVAAYYRRRQVESLDAEQTQAKVWAALPVPQPAPVPFEWPLDLVKRCLLAIFKGFLYVVGAGLVCALSIIL